MDEYYGILLPTTCLLPKHHEGSRKAQPAEGHHKSVFPNIRAAATILRLAPTISSAWLLGPGLEEGAG